MAWTEQHGDGFRVRYRLSDGKIITEPGFATQEDADNRADDIESDQRRNLFIDPRLAQTPIDKWIVKWSDAQSVTHSTWAVYSSHIRNHILPRWSGTALGDITRIAVKTWVNNDLRPNMADSTAHRILTVFSMIIGEAVDEELIETNPCRKLRIKFEESSERSPATTDEVDALAGRMAPNNGLMVITGAYTGLRWGEMTGLQWIRTYLDEDPRIEVDPKFGALHEVGNRLTLGPPKTPASVRTVHLPPFLAEQLTAHRERNPDARFVFTNAKGAFHRRGSFRLRAWLPALAGDETQGWTPLNQTMHFHDLRHSHETWLVEDNVPRILRLERLGHKRKDIDDRYSHVTRPMIDATLASLQQRWETDGGWTWQDNADQDQHAA